jgi:hypothetical protein
MKASEEAFVVFSHCHFEVRRNTTLVKTPTAAESEAINGSQAVRRDIRRGGCPV